MRAEAAAESILSCVAASRFVGADESRLTSGARARELFNDDARFGKLALRRTAGALNCVLSAPHKHTHTHTHSRAADRSAPAVAQARPARRRPRIRLCRRAHLACNGARSLTRGGGSPISFAARLAFGARVCSLARVRRRSLARSLARPTTVSRAELAQTKQISTGLARGRRPRTGPESFGSHQRA